MNRTYSSPLLLAVFLISAVAGCLAADGPPPEIRASAAAWPLPHKDYQNTRASLSPPIDRSNVETLGVAWAYPLSSPPRGNPIVTVDSVYVQDVEGTVYALDLYGNERWRSSFSATSLGDGGPAIGWGEIFVCVDNRLIALDALTGKQTWATTVPGDAGAIVAAQPVPYSDALLVATTSFQGGATGAIFALDAATGVLLWRFDTAIDDIWGNASINGGGGSRSCPAIDLPRAMTYWGVAGPLPAPGTAQYPNGSSRPGDNLYSNSVVALSPSQGTMDWFRQMLPHDLYGYSLSVPPVLCTREIGGRATDLLLIAGTMGRVFALDRETGCLIWDTRLGVHQNDDLATLPCEPIRVSPAEAGGIHVPMALADEVLYVLSNEQSAFYTSSATSVSGPPSSTLFALDISTGRIVWSQSFDAPAAGGVTAVNDLLFGATADGLVFAVDRATGDVVWRFGVSPKHAGAIAVGQRQIVLSTVYQDAPTLIAFELGAHAPQVYIASPRNDSWVYPDTDLTLRVEVFNVRITDKIGEKNVPGEGHLIFYRNVDAPTETGTPAFSAPGTYAVVADTTYTWHDLKMNAEGGYGFWVQWVRNDNTPLSPPILAALDINLIGANPD